MCVRSGVVDTRHCVDVAGVPIAEDAGKVRQVEEPKPLPLQSVHAHVTLGHMLVGEHFGRQWGSQSPTECHRLPLT